MEIIESKPKPNGQNRAFKNITINYPKIYDKKIAELIELGLTPSRSEFCRYAIKAHLLKHLTESEILGYKFEFDNIDINLSRDKRRRKRPKKPEKFRY